MGNSTNNNRSNNFFFHPWQKAKQNLKAKNKNKYKVKYFTSIFIYIFERCINSQNKWRDNSSNLNYIRIRDSFLKLKFYPWRYLLLKSLLGKTLFFHILITFRLSGFVLIDLFSIYTQQIVISDFLLYPLTTVTMIVTTLSRNGSTMRLSGLISKIVKNFSKPTFSGS